MYEQSNTSVGLQGSETVGIVEYEQFQSYYNLLRSYATGSQIMSLMFVDADNLKQVNDCLGHATGDQLIAEIGTALVEFLPTDAAVCRKGGDEFIACFCADTIEIAEKIADRVHWALNARSQVGMHELVIGCSSGFDTAPARLADFSTQLRQADIAMYCAKRSGKGCIKSFDIDECSAIMAEQELSADFPLALLNGELRVEFQPVFHISDRTIAGAEALVRWTHPELGEVGASQIVEIAAKCGRLSDLGIFVLSRSCLEAKDWPKDQLLNVNFCASDFTNPDFAPEVLSVLDSSEFDSFRLRIEITEGEKLVLLDTVASNIQTLRDRGVHVGIDDFGAGHASMASVDQYELDFLKIDRSLISNCDQRISCKTFIKAIAKVAAELNLDVVAEGVETLEEAAILRGMGIKWAQGYYYERPMLAETLTNLFVRPKKDYFRNYRESLSASVVNPPLGGTV